MELACVPAPVRRHTAEEVSCRSASGSIARKRLLIAVANTTVPLVKTRPCTGLSKTLKIIIATSQSHMGCRPLEAVSDSLILLTEHTTERKRRCTTQMLQCVSENGSVAKSCKQVIKILGITRIEKRNSCRTSL